MINNKIHLHSTLVPLILIGCYCLTIRHAIFTFYFSSFNSNFDNNRFMECTKFTFYFSSFNSLLKHLKWTLVLQFTFYFSSFNSLPELPPPSTFTLFTFYFSSFNSVSGVGNILNQAAFTFYFSSFNSKSISRSFCSSSVNLHSTLVPLIQFSLVCKFSNISNLHSTLVPLIRYQSLADWVLMVWFTFYFSSFNSMRLLYIQCV